VAAVFWFTGIFKGINLITLLGSLMLAIWALNAVGARRRLRRLRLRHWIDRPVFANKPVCVEIEVDNAGRPPPLGLRLEDRGPEHAITWFVPSSRERTPVRFRHDLTLPRRGWYAWERLRASSGYPFGLAEGRVSAASIEPVLVFPELGRLHRGRLRQFLRPAGPAGGRARYRPCPHPAAHSEFHGVREFRSGDSPRWIHWRTSARRGELMVREFEETPADNLILVLDPWLPSRGADLEAEDVAEGGPVLEEALSLAATICWEWCRQKGDELVLAVADPHPRTLAGVTGWELALRLLECLAVQQGTADPDLGGLADRLAAMPLPPAPILLVSTRANGFADRLANRLRRPVKSLDVSAPLDCDFYERPVDHAP
jgi:uncharacterized protein (DUF58 family)